MNNLKTMLICAALIFQMTPAVAFDDCSYGYDGNVTTDEPQYAEAYKVLKSKNYTLLSKEQAPRWIVKTTCENKIGVRGFEFTSTVTFSNSITGEVEIKSKATKSVYLMLDTQDYCLDAAVKAIKKIKSCK